MYYIKEKETGLFFSGYSPGGRPVLVSRKHPLRIKPYFTLKAGRKALRVLLVAGHKSMDLITGAGQIVSRLRTENQVQEAQVDDLAREIAGTVDEEDLEEARDKIKSLAPGIAGNQINKVLVMALRLSDLEN